MANNNGTLAGTMARLQTAAVGKLGVNETGTGAVTMLRLKTSVNVIEAYRGPVGVLAPLSVVCRSNGSMIWQFQGKPNHSVSWSVASGGGTITPFTAQTDADGRCFAKYDAGGYSGSVTLEVSYGS